MTTPTTRLDIIAKALGERYRHDSPQWVNEVAAVIDSALPPDSPPLPVVLPEVSDEDLEAFCSDYIRLDLRRALTAYHARLQASLPIWDPIEPGDIKPGMRVRFVDETAGYEVIIPRVDHLERSCLYYSGGSYWATLGRSWSVDPRTIPEHVYAKIAAAEGLTVEKVERLVAAARLADAEAGR